jgi:hypothetical protein
MVFIIHKISSQNRNFESWINQISLVEKCFIPNQIPLIITMKTLRILHNQTRAYQRTQNNHRINFVLLSVDRNGHTRDLGIFKELHEPLQKIEVLKLHNQYKTQQDVNYFIHKQVEKSFE